MPRGKAAKEDMSTIDDQVTGQVARAYLTALRVDADVEAAQADVDLAEAVVKQSQHQKDAGAGTGMDVTRASVQLANDQQRFLVAKNNQTQGASAIAARDEFAARFLRGTGGQAGVQTGGHAERRGCGVSGAREPSGFEVAAGARGFRAAERQRRSSMSGCPRWSLQCNYGTIGPPDVAPASHTGFLRAVRIPIFDGGRRDARRAEAFSQTRQERLRTADLRDQIELDVRLALDSLKSAEEQVKVARRGTETGRNGAGRRRAAASMRASPAAWKFPMLPISCSARGRTRSRRFTTTTWPASIWARRWAKPCR